MVSLDDFAGFRTVDRNVNLFIWSRLLPVGPVNYRITTDPVGFDASDHFVCGNRVTNLLQPAFEGALSDGFGHLGHFDRFRYE